MRHEDYKELLAAKALTALDADDARALDTHLESCAECSAEVDVWEQTVAFVALDANPEEPSPLVRQRILDSIQLKRRGRVVPFIHPQRNAWTSLRSFGAIAASLLFVALIASLVLLWQQNRAAQQRLARLTSQMNETKAQLAREQAMVAFLTSPGARMTELAGTKEAPDARAMLAYDKSGRAMLMAKGLPAAPAGMGYQLWFIKDGKKMPGKVFTTDAAGSGVLEDQVPAVAMNAAVFAITLEPMSGVQVPTGAIYLLSAS